jgi:hypothetical protein
MLRLLSCGVEIAGTGMRFRKTSDGRASGAVARFFFSVWMLAAPDRTLVAYAPLFSVYTSTDFAGRRPLNEAGRHGSFDPQAMTTAESTAQSSGRKERAGSLELSLARFHGEFFHTQRTIDKGLFPHLFYAG